jgi:PDZ domain-containing protein
MTASRRTAFAGIVAALVAVAALAVTPTPYWLIAPGSAVDLTTSIAVDGHGRPPDRYYLTDVNVRRATVLLLPAALLPGVRLVRQDVVIPAGETPGSYDRVLDDAMDQSQTIAAIVAERAAGLHVPQVERRTEIARVLPNSKALAVLLPGDVIEEVDGRAVAGPAAIGRAVGRLRPGESAVVTLERGTRTMRLPVGTIATPQGTRFGIVLETHLSRASLPVNVHYTLPDIAGSSGGLMFALRIYAALHHEPARAADSIAGTGTLDDDGDVGPIEGTQQKLIAAERAGARIFLVPRENYADVATERGAMRILPVGSFREALAALRS